MGCVYDFPTSSLPVGKTGNMRCICAEKELVPLGKPSLAFYTLAHVIIQFL